MSPDVAAWITTATPDTTSPCGHYNAATKSVCQATPTRQYIGGRRCHEHAPKMTHRKETT